MLHLNRRWWQWPRRPVTHTPRKEFKPRHKCLSTLSHFQGGASEWAFLWSPIPGPSDETSLGRIRSTKSSYPVLAALGTSNQQDNHPFHSPIYKPENSINSFLPTNWDSDPRRNFLIHWIVYKNGLEPLWGCISFNNQKRHHNHI